MTKPKTTKQRQNLIRTGGKHKQKRRLNMQKETLKRRLYEEMERLEQREKETMNIQERTSLFGSKITVKKILGWLGD